MTPTPFERPKPSPQTMLNLRPDCHCRAKLSFTEPFHLYGKAALLPALMRLSDKPLLAEEQIQVMGILKGIAMQVAS